MRRDTTTARTRPNALLTAGCLALAALCSVPAIGAPDGVIPLVPHTGARPAPADAPTLRHAAMDFRSERIDLDAIGSGDEFLLPVFADVQLPVLIGGVERSNGAVTMSGGVLSDDGAVEVGDFVASVVGDAITAAVWMDDGRIFEIRPDADGVTVAMQLESTAFDSCAMGPEHAVRDDGRRPIGANYLDGARGGACSDDGSVLDVLIVYTPAARNAMGGTNGITSLANSAVAAANNAYNNSDIPTRINLVHIAQVDYTESSFGTDLSRLRSTSDGNMDEVHDLRNQYNADFVAMLSAGSGSCGIAYLMTSNSPSFQSSAFSVTRYSCAVGNLTFAHELGHNMGCAHDRDNASGGLNSYSFGHRWFSTNGQRYRSVMSYSPGSRIAHFSNPNIDFIGTPTGVDIDQPNSAYNAQTIINSAPTIARFRLSGTAPVITNPPQPQSVDAGGIAIFQVGVEGNDISYQWFRDDVPLFDDARISGAGTANLAIVGVQASDAGDYTVAMLNGCGGIFSDPVALTIADACPADLTGNGALDFFDISAFIGAYNAGDTSADLAEPIGSLNFFDVAAYIALFNAGCP